MAYKIFIFVFYFVGLSLLYTAIAGFLIIFFVKNFTNFWWFNLEVLLAPVVGVIGGLVHSIVKATKAGQDAPF